MRWLALHEALHSHYSCEGERGYIRRTQIPRQPDRGRLPYYIYTLIFQCVKISLHRCIVIWIIYFAHALGHMYGFTEFHLIEPTILQYQIT